MSLGRLWMECREWHIAHCIPGYCFFKHFPIGRLNYAVTRGYTEGTREKNISSRSTIYTHKTNTTTGLGFRHTTAVHSAMETGGDSDERLQQHETNCFALRTLGANNFLEDHHVGMFESLEEFDLAQCRDGETIFLLLRVDALEGDDFVRGFVPRHKDASVGPLTDLEFLLKGIDVSHNDGCRKRNRSAAGQACLLMDGKGTARGRGGGRGRLVGALVSDARPRRWRWRRRGCRSNFSISGGRWWRWRRPSSWGRRRRPYGLRG